MAFFTGWLNKIGGADGGATLIGDLLRMRGIILATAADALDIWRSNGSGAALVSIADSALPAGAATSALQSAAPLTNIHSPALEASHVLSAAPCKVRSVKAINTGVTTAYLMLFDAAALPADGTAPSRCPIPIAAGDVNGDTWEGTTAFAIGCVAALSSTVATLTVTGAVGWFDAEVL
jgi:hypothetical protein